MTANQDVVAGNVTYKRAAISASANGDNTLIAAMPGKRIRVFQYLLMAASNVTVRFESNAGGTALSGVMSIAGNGGQAPPWCPPGCMETDSGHLLNLELSSGVQVSGWIIYAEVD